MTPSPGFFFPDRQDQRPVHVQDRDRRESGRRESDDRHAVPLKVVCPALAARVEQGDSSTRRGVTADRRASLRSEHETHARARLSIDVLPFAARGGPTRLRIAIEGH